ncbi:MAG: M4 family metallopeptidase [Acidobacteriota bacterium]
MPVSRLNNQDNAVVGDPIADINRTVGPDSISAPQGTTSGEANRNVGPLSLRETLAQSAIDTSLNHLRGPDRVSGINDPSRELVARSVDRDELGMMHVRMDRVYNGLKVYGQQVVTHLGQDGNVRSVSGETGQTISARNFSTRPNITSDDALRVAGGLFVGEPTVPPQAELLIYPTTDGEYKLAYHVQMTNLSGENPSKMNYFIDANTGQMIDHFNALPVFCPHCKAMMLAQNPNQSGSRNTTPTTTNNLAPNGNSGIVPPWLRDDTAGRAANNQPRTRVMPGGNQPPQRRVGTGSLLDRVRGAQNALATAVTVNGSATPNAPIRDFQATTSTIDISDDVKISGLKVNVDIGHTYRGDLLVKLRSPEGKEITLHNRTGGSADNLVLEANPADFNGLNSKGQWSLIVEDKAAQDSGTLKAWKLAITGEPKTPPPTPDVITKTETPNAAIRDLQTTTSTIRIDNDGEVENLKVNVDIGHTYRGDLLVKLVSPSGKEATLHNRTGGSADNLTFEVEPTDFVGEQIRGDWKLVVQDTARADEGTLKSWGLNIKKKGGGTPPPPPPPTGEGRGSSLYSGDITFQTKRNADGSYTMTDETRGNSRTLDAQNRTSGPGVAINDNDNNWTGTGDPTRNRVAVDAHYGMQQTWDFYKNVLGRNSIDGNGAALISNVHIQNNYNNAFWDGQQMSYGDGDGRTFSPLASIDVAGHEITHGLTERTAGLIYRGESGGLNEAISDIMGTAIEWYTAQRNPNVQFDWKIGEDIYTPGQAGDALRYMDDPTKDNYSVDNYRNYPQQTEVHGSSGIANNAFYLLVNGGTNRTSGLTVTDGIGMEKGAKIFFRALSFYMTPSTNFKQGREATVRAAADLYGENSLEVQKVREAWTAVGVE